MYTIKATFFDRNRLREKLLKFQGKDKNQAEARLEIFEQKNQHMELKTVEYPK